MASNKLDEVEHFIKVEHNFDIVAITKSHLDSTVCDSRVSIGGYNLYRKDRNRNGGGVCFYVDENLSCNRRTDLEIQDLEMIWMEVRIGTTTNLIASCYRPPGQPAAERDGFLSNFELSIDLACNVPNISSITILGEFNDRCVDWDSDHTNSELGNKFKFLIQNSLLFQLIKDPTRDLNLLDLLLTDSPIIS